MEQGKPPSNPTIRENMFGTFAIRIFFSKSYSGLIKKEAKMQGDLKKNSGMHLSGRHRFDGLETPTNVNLPQKKTTSSALAETKTQWRATSFP